MVTFYFKPRYGRGNNSRTTRFWGSLYSYQYACMYMYTASVKCNVHAYMYVWLQSFTMQQDFEVAFIGAKHAATFQGQWDLKYIEISRIYGYTLVVEGLA